MNCEIENNGKKSAASIPAKQPYVLVPGELYALDYTWFVTGALHLAKHNETKDDLVNVYVIADSRIHADRPIELTYAGEVTARIMGKVQSVTEYEGWQGSELEAWKIPGISVLRVTSQDLVASVGWKSNPELGFAITNYKQYEPWPPSR